MQRHRCDQVEHKIPLRVGTAIRQAGHIRTADKLETLSGTMNRCQQPLFGTV